VVADLGRRRQILLTFAGNAVKFTETGGVLLTAEPAAEGRLRLTVRDTGPGVPEAARKRIFEPFVHADPSHGAVLGGAGLGLAIVTRLSDAMGGAVGVGEAAGGGAEFWIEAAFPPVGPALTHRPLKGHTVGVASSNPIVLEAARRQTSGPAFSAAAPPDSPAI